LVTNSLKDEASTSQILDTVTEFINHTITERCVEGNNLTLDLDNRISIIKQEMQIISERAHKENVLILLCKNLAEK
jgi:uncharacterized protein YicC (UPF0701 family)